jgi:SH3-like domain-containing protein
VSPRFPRCISPGISQASILTAAILLAACAPPRPEPTAAIGTAYPGPATLNLRADIDPKSPVTAIVHHGDKLDIVARRRRLYRVRTAKGKEGWATDRDLLDSGQMQRLRKLSEETANLQSQGVASTFAPVNVHAEPNRLSASFIQLQPKEKFDILAHRVEARVAPPRRELIPPAPKPEKKLPGKKGAKGKEEKAAVVPPPPPPPPPPAPPDTSPAKPVANDDWTLIRTKSGQTGWVLTSSIYLEIPDEVAQYAEGHRITSYFSIGKTLDAGEEKDIWLWTTSETLGEDHDFDSYRVFTWSLRRHRYETAYIQRREKGYFPVLAKMGEFSVCLEMKDGTRARKRYTLNGNAVRPAGEIPCGETAKIETTPAVQALPEAPEAPPAPGLAERLKTYVNKLRGK